MARTDDPALATRVNCLDLRKGPADRVRCKHCGEVVAMTQSARTGKWYTCQIVTHHTAINGTASERYVPWAPHFKKCPGR